MCVKHGPHLMHKRQRVHPEPSRAPTLLGGLSEYVRVSPLPTEPKEPPARTATPVEGPH